MYYFNFVKQKKRGVTVSSVNIPVQQNKGNILPDMMFPASNCSTKELEVHTYCSQSVQLNPQILANSFLN